MKSHFGYATHDKDNLINLVRSSIGALPSNIIAPVDLQNGLGTAPDYQDQLKDFIIEYFLNHGILTTYLFNPTLKSQVIENLIETAQLLESNCNNASIKINQQKNLKASFDSTDPDDKDVTDLTYVWNFGSGEGADVSTTSKAIDHTYSKAGKYTVKLIVKNNDGDTDTKSIEVIIHEEPKSVINYTKNNLNVNFDSIGNTDLTGLTYAWNFGDNQTSALKNPSHNYSQAGTYSVSLTVTDSYGVSVNAQTSVVVQSGAIAFKFAVDFSNSYIKARLLINDTSSTNRPPSMFSVYTSANVSAAVGASVTFLHDSAGTLDCGSWIKTATHNSITFSHNNTFTCTRGADSPEMTSIIYRDSFIVFEGWTNPLLSVYYKIPGNNAAPTLVNFLILQRYDQIERLDELHYIGPSYPSLFLF